MELPVLVWAPWQSSLRHFLDSVAVQDDGMAWNSQTEALHDRKFACWSSFCRLWLHRAEWSKVMVEERVRERRPVWSWRHCLETAVSSCRGLKRQNGWKNIITAVNLSAKQDMECELYQCDPFSLMARKRQAPLDCSDLRARTVRRLFVLMHVYRVVPFELSYHLMVISPPGTGL